VALQQVRSLPLALAEHSLRHGGMHVVAHHEVTKSEGGRYLWPCNKCGVCHWPSQNTACAMAACTLWRIKNRCAGGFHHPCFSTNSSENLRKGGGRGSGGGEEGQRRG
jgi:hypothetical protein